MGTGVLPVTQSVDPGAVVSAHATTRGDGSVQVMAINKTATAQSLSINLTGYVPQAGKGVAIYVLASAGDYTSSSATYNGQTDPDPTLALPAPTTQAVSGTTFSYSIAAYAMAVLDFGGTGIIPDAGADSSSGSSSSGSDSGGSGIDAGIDAGIGRDASLGTFADGGGANGAASDGSSSGSSGCGCTVVGSSDGAMPGLVALGGLAATFAFRRRRRETRISKASRGHEGREKT